MQKIIEFEGFKFKKTNFRFKSTKDMNRFFNQALIESPIKFVRLNEQMFLEKMHVAFSWMMLSKFLAFALFVPALIAVYYNAPQWIGLSIVGLSLFFFMRKNMLSKRLHNLAAGQALIDSLAEDRDSLEEVRQELIKENK